MQDFTEKIYENASLRASVGKPADLAGAQAWTFFKHYFSKRKPVKNHQEYDHGGNLESNIIGIMNGLKKKYSSGGFDHKQAALWGILNIWMKIHRKSLAALLTKKEYSYNHVGLFFNFIFSRSIQNLTLQLAG